jgi:hypothetical protein
MKVLPSFAAQAGIVLMVTAVMFLTVEGAASLLSALREPSDGVVLERAHTEFDPELGWVNRKNLRVENLYGPGRYFQSNSQRFRNQHDFSVKVPDGRVRAICTGDSFTLGYGVSNEEAWCELLSRKDPRFETVNMGQGGYGVDQAYLWYRRDGVALEHDVLIFAFIEEDFERMMNRTFLGYPKPVLSPGAGTPVVVLRPTSRTAFLLAWLRQRMAPLAHLHSVGLFRSTLSSETREGELAMDLKEGRALAANVFDAVKSLAASRGADLIAVLLPILDDYEHDDPWHAFVEAELSRRQIPFVDLVAALRREPEPRVRRLFSGHYSELGNRWVAEHLYASLIDLPRVSERLERIPPPIRVSVAPEPARLEAISIESATIRANPMGDLAPLAKDGSMATRWHSGAPQRGNEVVVLDLGRSEAVREIKLRLGAVPYDYGRILSVDVAEDESRYAEVVRATAHEMQTEADDVQVLDLPAKTHARFIRIRQLGRTDTNFWSICEVELYRERE